MADTSAPEKSDWVSSQATLLLYWGLPVAVLLFQAIVLDGLMVKTILIAAAWTAMGVACLMNAAHCGRMHCYFTGPFFLLGALVALLHGVGIVPLSWTTINLGTGIGASILWYWSEKVWGTYRGGS